MNTRTESYGRREITRTDYEIAVHVLGIIDALAVYDPHVAGTPPLDIHTEASDIDILFSTLDPSGFVADVWRLYAHMSGFRIWQWTSKDRPVVATFRAYGWDFELFASSLPVAQQFGWRHFEIERRLLSLGGSGFKRAIQTLRQDGLKTEPAFWAALKLEGDAYLGLLSLEQATDDELRAQLGSAGFDQTISG
ncbi:DUF4269 domain-containing protein [Rhizobium rhizophilum]|uniref:DUF4269 domain-containing protein n=1 Tax=Rhizobium rhizophilum TaxID=1850373 RepID=A0ABY2QR50_9HYPH|nr:DUF4269 domain-containing protein [Rhizobium rhizophilum]THV12494.1 DUF4269 domain-containing protein [Rhizobium rhizophilum]